MAVDNFFGNPIPLTPTASAWLGGSNLVNGAITVGSQNTQVAGPAGTYTIIGGSGSNTYYLGSTVSLVQAATTGIDTVVAALDYIMPSTITNLVMNSGSFGVLGNSGANYIVGTAGSNQIDGGGGNDVLTGGSGTAYVFDGGNTGYTLITDFVPGADADGGKTDEVRLNGYSQFATFAEVQAAMTQVGSDVVLTLNGSTAIKFADTQISQFTAANFELALSPSSYGASTFSDNFSTLSLYNGTSGTWSTLYGWGGNPDSVEARSLPETGEKELYVDTSLTGTGTTSLGLNPFSVSDGVLTIHAGPTPAADVSKLWGYDFTSGMISTRYTFSQTYGYFDAEMKLPSGQGNWPAFWLYAVNAGSELDIFEEQNGSDEVTGTAHNNGVGGAATGVKAYIPNLTDGFHNFGVLWTPQTITWYVDGVSIGSIATPSNLNSPMYIIANLGLNSTTPSNYAGGNLEIEYIHAYTLANSPVTAPTTTTATTTSTTSTSTTPAATPVAPSLTSLTATLPTGATTLKAGATAQISVTLSENVTVTGAPTLTLSDGETATYVKGSGSNVLTFNYTASAGDSTSDLQVSALNLTNGAKIADANGLTLSSISGDLKVSVDAVAPTVTSMSAVSTGTTGMLTVGGVATVTLKLSEAVTVTGTPELQLNDGGLATYVSGSGTNTLTFTYAAATSQHTDLHVTGLVLPTGASVQDSAGNALTSASGDLNLWISTYEPVNTGITSATSTGTSYVHTGQTVTFTMNTSEAVTVSGQPNLTLSDGGVATYVGGSGTNALTFSYVVKAGQTSSDLEVTGVALGTNGAIVDSLGNPFSGSVATLSHVTVDTTSPTFLGVTASSGASTNLNTGASEMLTVKTSEIVDVAGAPTLQLSDGETATYVSGSGTSSLTFAYTATAGHTTTDLQVTGLHLPTGSSIQDLAGNSAVGTVTGDLHQSVNTPGVEIVYGTGSYDVFVAQSSSEIFVEPAVNDGRAMVLSDYSFTLPANVTALHLEGSANITGTGNNLNDTIYANTGNDTLIAGSGADTLIGSAGNDTMIAGTGNDTMTGGFGSDTFVFKPGAGHDVITNFANFGGKDVLDISAFLTAGLTPHLTDTSAGEMITFTDGASIELLGVHSNQLVSTAVGYLHS
jgi:beta-glucanase (GH16 family)